MSNVQPGGHHCSIDASGLNSRESGSSFYCILKVSRILIWGAMSSCVPHLEAAGYKSTIGTHISMHATWNMQDLFRRQSILASKDNRTPTDGLSGPNCDQDASAS